MRISRAVWTGLVGCLPLALAAAEPRSGTHLLDRDSFRHYIDAFRANDREQKVNAIGNDAAWPWLRESIPFFESSDKTLEEIYYFRWWTFRKHIKKTPEGFIVTEFLPDVPWAGKWNSISCAAAHHFYEGRWLRDRRYLADYARFWFGKGGDPQLYSFWVADAIRAWSLVTHDQQLPISLFPALAANYAGWEKTHQDPNGLFWQIDDRDGMEYSVGGSGYRPTINSYMYGEALALGDIARWAWKDEASFDFRMKAARLRELVEDKLWDQTYEFYKTLPRETDSELVAARELVGYVPWYFNLPHAGHEAAWKELLDPRGFYAPFGPTTAERRAPRYRFENPHECLWNGPSWPYATSQTLTAMANLLNNYRQSYVTKVDYLKLLRIYARSHHMRLPDGRVIPFIDENLDPDTGEWLARKLLYAMPPDKQVSKGGKDRGRDYNHSTFNDLIISGLVGLRPRADAIAEVNPLVPGDALDYFCLDGVRYHDFDLTIFWDRTGRRYRRGKGLHVLANGIEIASRPDAGWLSAKLPEATSGWRKSEHNPLIGKELGTVFDITVLREDGRYRMWGSWRPKKSLALFESTDGVTWSQPVIVLGPEPSTGWEDDINRPAVVKRADGYHMWYTGQANDRSAIGYATSRDGKVWQRMSAKPVLAPAERWEGVALMCPHVIWDEETRRFRMWYSGGENYEPNALGYATSPNGFDWTRHASNPIFGPDPANVWDQDRVAAAQILKHGEWFYMFYVGFRDIEHAQIGVARSRDGVTNWERHPGNPIVRPGQDGFDHDACYKPFAVFDGRRWLLWYNGRHGHLEQIGLTIHDGADLGFESGARVAEKSRTPD